jgi:hypothetical protein
MVTVTFMAKAGRRYKISGFGTCYNSGAANSYLSMSWNVSPPPPIGGNVTLASNYVTPINVWIAGAFVTEVTVATDQVVTASISAAAAGAGVAQTPSNACYIIVEDVGASSQSQQ